MNTKTIIQSIGLGVAFWFGFLLMIRLIGTTVFTIGNPLLPVMFIVTVPITIATVVLISRMTNIPFQELTMPVVIMTMTAIMLDGLSVGFTDFYGATHEQVRASASVLLWGGGIGILCTLVMAARAENAAERAG